MFDILDSLSKDGHEEFSGTFSVIHITRKFTVYNRHVDPALEEGLHMPQEADFESLAELKSYAFAEKRGCCGSRPDDVDTDAPKIVDQLKMLLGTAKQVRLRLRAYS